MAGIEFAPEYGYVVLTFVGYALTLYYLAHQVGVARRKYGVKYPTMYARAEDVKEAKDANTFNCVQRGHQNALEAAPIFVPLLFFGGLFNPIVAAGAGVLYTASRVVYAKCYASGDPKQRSKAFFGYLGLITLLVLTLGFALRTIGLPL